MLTAGCQDAYLARRDTLTVGSGEFLPLEFPLAYWLEQHGYDVAYCTNSDRI